MCVFTTLLKEMMVYESVICKTNRVSQMRNSRWAADGFRQTYFWWLYYNGFRKASCNSLNQTQIAQSNLQGWIFSLCTFNNNKIIYEGQSTIVCLGKTVCVIVVQISCVWWTDINSGIKRECNCPVCYCCSLSQCVIWDGCIFANRWDTGIFWRFGLYFHPI
jgi:hypothetical protein